jgi:hypothetical protein
MLVLFAQIVIFLIEYFIFVASQCQYLSAPSNACKSQFYLFFTAFASGNSLTLDCLSFIKIINKLCSVHSWKITFFWENLLFNYFLIFAHH